MIVYQLTSYSVNSTEMYPLELYEKDNLQLFSTIALALENMNQQIAEKNEEYPNLFFRIATLGVDEEVEWKASYYNHKGEFLTDDLFGESPATTPPIFTPGTIVEFFKHGTLALGVVYAAPEMGQEGVYLIDELEGEHDHIPEALITLPRYPLTPAQTQAYQELSQDVLSRLARKDRSGPKNIPTP